MTPMPQVLQGDRWKGRQQSQGPVADFGGGRTPFPEVALGATILVTSEMLGITSPSRHQYFHVLRCMSLGYASSKHLGIPEHPTPENHQNPAKKEPYRDHFHLEKTISASASVWWTASLLLLEGSTAREFQMKAKGRVVQQSVGLKQSCRNL